MIIVDFETRSLADLTEVGGRNYAEHPSTDVICCVARNTHDPTWRGIWVAGEVTPGWSFLDASFGVAAHNADGFDTFIWRRLGWPEPRRWYDTSAMARSSGLPGKLEVLLERYGRGYRKDMTGNAITLALSDTKLPPSRKDKHTGEPVVAIPEEIKAALREYHKELKASIIVREYRLPFEWPAIPPIVLEAVVDYCSKDVDGTVDVVWPLVADFADLEPRGLDVWRAANDRGVLFDVELARALLEADARVTAAALERAGVDAIDVRGPARFINLMAQRGVMIANAQYDTVEPLTRYRTTGARPEPQDEIDKLDAEVRAIAEARLALASIASGKLKAGLARVSADGRMRDNVRYFGAHTGRGAGGGMQLQNIPHPEGLGVDGWSVVETMIDGVKHPGWDDARVCLEAERPRLYNQAEISMLLRACVKAPPGHVLVCADFSGVEARANAWAAGDHAAVETFKAGGDAYAKLACSLFGIERERFSKKTHFFERDTSKKAELGCGYQMGAPKFKITAEKGGMRWKSPDLCVGDACADPVCGVIEHDDSGKPFTHGAKTIVTAWRQLHRPIVDFWYALERASVEAADGRTSSQVDCAIDLSFVWDAGDLALVLPSDRPVVYRRAHVVDGKYGPQVKFQGALGWNHLYGGLLCENAIQATCREFLVNGMINAEDAGLPVVLTVHDEIVAEVPERLAELGLKALEEAMTTLPAWADGMPIAVEGFICRRYRK